MFKLQNKEETPAAEESAEVEIKVGIAAPEATHGWVANGFYEDDMGIRIHEVKDIPDLERMKTSITKQAIERWTAFGDDIRLEFVVSPTLSWRKHMSWSAIAYVWEWTWGISESKGFCRLFLRYGAKARIFRQRVL